MSNLVKMAQSSLDEIMLIIKDASLKAPGSSTTQALVVGAVIGFVMLHLMRKRHNLPPGPRPIPLLGNFMLLKDKSKPLFENLFRLSKEKYGPVMSFYFGPTLCVFLNDADSIHEALVKKGADFAGRPHVYSFDLITEGSKDIAMADYCPTWKLHRKISMQAIRLYMRGTRLEKTAHDVVTMVMDKMAEEPGAFDPHQYNTKLMFHMIDRMCFGDVKDFDDPTIAWIIEAFEKLNKDGGNGFYEDLIPPLRYFPTKSFREITGLFFKFLDYCESRIKSHRETLNPDNLRDVTDSILLAQKEAEREESAEAMAMITDVHVRQTISDLFGAGVDTSRLNLDWALLYMAGIPEIQKKAQAEIDAATGSRLPGVNDRSKLVYTEAVLYEVLRLGCVGPLSLPHKTLCDSIVGGYDIPKDTMVMVNLWGATHDPALWENPSEFKPERFLDENGKIKTAKPDGWLPFSAGKRVCLGENVAKPTLLLVFSCLLKRFDISLPDGATFDPSVDPSVMSVSSPKAFKIVVTPR